MIIAFNVLRFYFLAVYYFLSGNKKDRALYYSGKCLLQNVTYRHPASAARNPLIGLGALRRVLFRLLSGHRPSGPVNLPNDHLIFDGQERNRILRTEYIQWHTGNTPVFISRDHLVFIDFSVQGIFTLLMVILISPFVIISCVVSRDRSNLALLLTEFIECCNLIRIVQRWKIKTIHIFCPYEIDSNLQSYILQKCGILVFKHPSPGPLMTHNSVLIADTLVLSSQYQAEELLNMKETVFVSGTKKWFPEFSLSYIDRYAGKKTGTSSDVIGYYSHGSWLRSEKGHSDDGLNILQGEDILLRELRSYLTAHAEIRLIIFPHPDEKRIENMSRTETFYSNYFRGLNYSVFAEKANTSLQFEKADVAVAAFSTIVYERLFCGFKTLVGAYGINGFPVANSALKNIALKENGELERKLSESLKLNTEEFFKENMLAGYRYMEFEPASKLFSAIK